MAENYIIEELEDIDLSELEFIEKGTKYLDYDFPVVHVLDKHLYFNYLASPMVPKYIQWAVTPELIVGREADKGNRNAYKARKSSDSSCMVGTFPARLRQEKKLQKGIYKVYKCKGGFAFKRYERIEDEEN